MVEGAGPDGFGWAIQWLAALFYADYGLLVSPSPAWIQEVMDVLTVLLDSFGLHNNVEKTVGLV